MLRGVAPGPLPAEPAGLPVREGLSCNAARPVRPRQRLAVEIDRLVEPAVVAVGPDLPPQRQRNVEEPAPQCRGLAGEIAHATGSFRVCAMAHDLSAAVGRRHAPIFAYIHARRISRPVRPRTGIGGLITACAGLG